MTDPAPTDPAPAPTPATTGADPTPATDPAPGADPQPPWGDPANFDAERAWSLIQNLRSDKDKMAPEIEELRGKVKEFEDAKLTTEQKAARDLEESQKTSAGQAIEIAKLKAVIEHGLSADDIELIGGSSAEEITDKAAKLAARLGSAAPKPPAVTNRPGEQPRGGSDPTTNPETGDWLRTALAKAD